MPSVTFFKKRHRLVVAIVAILAVSAAAWAADGHRVLSTPPAASAPGASPHTAQPMPVGVVQNSSAPVPVAVPASVPLQAPVAPAADAIPADDSAYNDLVSKLGREHYVLTLQSQNAELKKKIADSLNEGSSLPAPSVIVAPPASMTPQSGIPGAPPHGDISSITLADPSHSEGSSTQPLRLTSVIIVGGNYQATLVDHGVDCTVHVGSTLSEGWYVDRIAPSSVELSHGRRHRVLHVSG